jgi:alkanesulfonate monooxygenase SsuD/methylene tetrahydromethanopterin reductase-like flavin-dependent oxidoreductase (luciferase family)
MASAARTVSEISDGRFVLGIGVSHKPIVAGRAHSYDKPYTHMKQYLPSLKERLNSSARTPPIPILIAALDPKMLDLWRPKPMALKPYFVPPEHTAKVRAQIGSRPWICVEQAVIL